MQCIQLRIIIILQHLLEIIESVQLSIIKLQHMRHSMQHPFLVSAVLKSHHTLQLHCPLHLVVVLSFQGVERFIIHHIVAPPRTAHPCFVCSLQVLQVVEYYEYHIAAHEAPRAAAAQGLPDCNFRCLRLSLCFDSSTCAQYLSSTSVGFLRSPTSGWNPFGPFYFISSRVTYTSNPPPLGNPKVFRKY